MAAYVYTCVTFEIIEISYYSDCSVLTIMPEQPKQSLTKTSTDLLMHELVILGNNIVLFGTVNSSQ